MVGLIEREASPVMVNGSAYLSELTLDTTSRLSWRVLGDIYQVHRMIMSAFPDLRDRDSEERLGRVLFRIETPASQDAAIYNRGRQPYQKILVQSQDEPDWSRFESLAAHTIVHQVRGPKLVSYVDGDTPIFREGQRFQFRLRGNATRDVICADGVKRRVAILKRRDQGEWLERKAAAHGFRLDSVPTGEDWLNPLGGPEDRRETDLDVSISQTEGVYGKKPLEGAAKGYHSVFLLGTDFEGILTVTDPAKFVNAVTGGIGRGKAFGFGLLSLRRPDA